MKTLSISPLMLSIQLALAVAGGITSTCILAQDGTAGIAAQSSQQFEIAAGSLDRVLSQFALDAGIGLYMDASLSAGKHSAGLRGSYSIDAGLMQILSQTGLIAQRQRDGSYQLLESASSATHQLPAVLVEGARYTESDLQYHEPRSVSVITREQIDQRPPRHAADMLEQTSGIYSAVNQRDPGLSVNIRGIQDYGRVNMNIDGMRQNFSINGHQQRNGVIFIDPELIESIQIDKGAVSQLGSAGTLGGIATFNTINASQFLEPGKTFGGRLRAGHGIGNLSNGTFFNGSAVFAMGNEQADVLVGWSERNFGNYYAGTNNPDNLGSNIRGRDLNPEAWEDWLTSEVEYMDSVTRSQIIKIGTQLAEDQRLQFSYLETDTDSKDAWTYMNSDTNRYYYRHTGSTDANSRSAALDYSFNPNQLIDLNAKLYLVKTGVDKWSAESTASQSSGNWYPDYTDRVETETWGLQLENTSLFSIGQQGMLSLNYGGELYRDQFSSSTTRERAVNETVLPYIPGGANPEGTRWMGSLFGHIDYQHGDWLTIDAGLRYDRYRLQGEAGMTLWMYKDGQFQSGTGREQQHLIFDVDQEAGRLSPSLGIAVNPGVDWLQLYTRWGKGWRPPTTTESFMSGRPHAGSSSQVVYPNPYLEAERSQNWELGFNVFTESMLTPHDRLGIKVAYFDTRIDNFIFMDTNVSVPGGTVGGISMGRSAYQNNQEETRFRGIEYNLDYDTGNYYAQLNYTQMLGSNNFCSKEFYIGGAQELVQVGTEPGFIQVGPIQIPVNIPIYEARLNDALNDLVSCGHIMGNASYMPSDRGSLTLGTRLLDRRLDMGARMRYSPGNGEHLDGSWAGSLLDKALWPRYKVYDLYANFRVTPALNLTLAMENVTDEAYFVAMGDVNNLSLARGRTLTGMLEYRF